MIIMYCFAGLRRYVPELHIAIDTEFDFDKDVSSLRRPKVGRGRVVQCPIPHYGFHDESHSERKSEEATEDQRVRVLYPESVQPSGFP